MASNIKFKRSAVQNRVPTTAQLDLGELALNTYDGKLYTEINTGSAAVVEIGSKLSSLVVDGANGAGGGDVVFHGQTAGRDVTWDYSDNALEFAQNAKATFGDSLFIYNSSAAANVIAFSSTDLFVTGSNFRVTNPGISENIAWFKTNAEVELYYNNGLRFETTQDGADIFGTGSLKIPVGTTAQRSSSPTNGDLRYNTTTGGFEGYSNNNWGELGAGGIGIGSTSTNPSSGVVGNRIGVGFTDINIVGTGVSVTGYGTTIVIDFNDFKPGSFHRTIHNYIATAGQTTFAGLNYEISEKQIAVYLNGARLSEATYTATSGTTVVLDVGASLGDEVEIINIHTNSDVDRKVNTYTATAGQTTFTGLSYNSKQELDVYLNGIRLASADYTATSGNTVVLAVGASVNDTVDIVSTGDGITWRSTTDASGDRFTLNNVGIGTDQTPDKLNVRGNSSFVGVTTFTGTVSTTGSFGTSGQIQSTYNHASQPRLYLSGISGSGGYNYLLRGDNDAGSRAVHFVNGSSRSADNGANTYTIRNDNGKLHLGRNTQLTVLQGSTTYLQHNTSTKLNTTSTGINVTGLTDTDTLNVSGTSTFQDDVTFQTANGLNIAVDKSDNALEFGKDVKIKLYEALQIYRDNNHAFIDHTSGSALKIRTDILRINDIANDHSMIHADRDSSVKLYFDNTKRFETTNTGSKVTGNLEVTGVLTYDDVTNIDAVGIITARNGIFVPDSQSIHLGNVAGGGDLQLTHNGSHSFIKDSGTGNLIVNTSAFQIKDQSDSTFALTAIPTSFVKLFYNNSVKFETQSTGAKVTGQLDVAASVNNEGIKVTNSANNAAVILRSTGSTDTGGFRFNHNSPNSQITIDRTTGNGAFSSNLIFISSTGDLKLVNDNAKLQVGASQDLSIYHDGSHSYIDDTGTGNLKVRSNNFRVSNTDESKISGTFVPSGAVELYHNNSKKFETTSSGATVSGQLTAGMSGGQNPSTTSWATNSALNLYGSFGGGIAFNDNGNNGFVMYVQNTGTVFNLKAGAVGGSTEQVIRAVKDGQVELFYNNTKRFETTNTGGTLTGALTINTSTNEQLILSGSNNPYIQFHEGSTSKARIQWSESGYLWLQNQEDNSVIVLRDDIGFSPDAGSTIHKIWHAGNDGSGSGLDADTVDGFGSGQFLRSDTSDTASGAITFTSGQLQLSGHYYQGYHSAAQNYIHFYPANPSSNAGSSAVTTDIRAWTGSSFDVLRIQGGNNTITWRANTIWHSGNDGSGSGLDADTLDGLQTSSSGNRWGVIPFVHTDGVMEVGRYIDFHNSDGDTSDHLVRFESIDSNTIHISGNKIWHAGNDGTGSGLDADTVDGIEGASFLRSDANDTASGLIQFTSSSQYPIDINSTNDGKLLIRGSSNPYIRFREGNTDKAYIQWVTAGILQFVNQESGEYLRIGSGSNGLTFTEGGNERTVFHTGNDGSGSGLDADTLDGVQGASYLRSDANDTATGTLTVRDILISSNYHLQRSNHHSGHLEGSYNNVGENSTKTNPIYTIGSSYNPNDNTLSDMYGIGYTHTNASFINSNIPTTQSWGLYVAANGVSRIFLSGNSGSIWPTGRYGRLNHHTGFLEGSYNNVGANTTKSNPIYTIGSSYNPTESALSNMYGIGFTHANSSFISFTGASAWGLYVAADGDARVWLDGSNGVVSSTGQHYVGSNVVWNAGNDGSGSGLDADTLDGVQGASFLRSDASDSSTQPVTFSGGGGAISIGGGSDIRFNNGNWTGNSGTTPKIQAHSNYLYIVGGSNGIIFREDGTDRARFDGDGHFRPATNNTYDCGTSGNRWRNVYTNDLNLSNEGGANDVDGTWGNFTIQEGEDDLFLINKRNGKKYKFNLTEV